MTEEFPLIQGALKRTLLLHTKNAAPREACGVIIRGHMVQVLKNHSASPENSFEIHRGELRALIEKYQVPVSRIAEDVVLWHSHPAGGVGPSRTDMQQKTPLKRHLVVSLVDDDLVATWY